MYMCTGKNVQEDMCTVLVLVLGRKHFISTVHVQYSVVPVHVYTITCSTSGGVDE